jgi:hypothetical protein
MEYFSMAIEEKRIRLDVRLPHLLIRGKSMHGFTQENKDKRRKKQEGASDPG